MAPPSGTLRGRTFQSLRAKLRKIAVAMPLLMQADGPQDGPPFELWHSAGPGGRVALFDSWTMFAVFHEVVTEAPDVLKALDAQSKRIAELEAQLATVQGKLDKANDRLRQTLPFMAAARTYCEAVADALRLRDKDKVKMVIEHPTERFKEACVATDEALDAMMAALAEVTGKKQLATMFKSKSWKKKWRVSA